MQNAKCFSKSGKTHLVGKCGFIGFFGILYSKYPFHNSSSHVGQMAESSNTSLKVALIPLSQIKPNIDGMVLVLSLFNIVSNSLRPSKLPVITKNRKQLHYKQELFET
jgi:hypothetical protein